MSGVALALRRFLRRDLVLVHPSLPLARLRSGAPAARSAPPFPLDGARAILTFSGTSATAQAIAALELAPGDTVLCPSYACGHEIEPMLRAGIPLEFYRVDGRLQVDLDDLRRRLRPPVRAVLVTHYFGFPQPLAPLRRLCDEYGAYLIEDCAHAFLSWAGDRPLGSVGDVAIFSMRKTLPIPDGGAAVLNRADLEPRGALRPPSRLSTLAKTLELWERHLMRPGPLASFAPAHAALALAAPLLLARHALRALAIPSAIDWYDPDDERLDFDSRLLDWSMSATSRALLEQFDGAPIKAIRRRNHAQLGELLAPLGPAVCPLAELPDGVCPLVFPILCDERDRIVDALWEQGISAPPWWEGFPPAIPWQAFPEATSLKNRMLVLPVHQEVEPAGIERTARAVLALLRP